MIGCFSELLLVRLTDFSVMSSSRRRELTAEELLDKVFESDGDDDFDELCTEEELH